MTSPHDRLGIAPGATPAEIKVAYHAKLREFPAHSHPEEFKAIREAYESIRKGDGANPEDAFLKFRPIEVTADPDLLKQVREKALTQIEVSLEELIRTTF